MAEEGLIHVPYVQKVTKGGQLHLYFRKGDYREGPLANALGTQELKDEVDAIVARVDKAQKAARTPKPGTVGGMLRAYTGHIQDGVRTKASADFITLASTTQQMYADLADEMVQDFGAVHLQDVSRAWVIELRDAWAPRGHRAANNRMQVLKNALAPAVDDEKDNRIEGDPFHRVQKVRRPKGKVEAHPRWEDVEVEIAIEDAISSAPGLARAIALGRYAGFRRGTICKVPRRARTERTDDEGEWEHRLLWLTEKREVLCDKREDPRLTAVLERTPNRALTIAYNADGDPWKERALNQALDRHMAKLAKDGRVRAAVDEHGVVFCPLTIHGLRHSRGVELADAGASDAEIMAQLEHRTDRSAKEYRRQSQRRKLADHGQDRVDNVVKMKAAKAKKAAGARS